MTAKEIISSITEDWFLDEPLMFDVFCSHKLTENTAISTIFRTGQGRIEYNPRLVEQNENSAKSALSTEIFRILLNHPYERVPIEPNRIALKKASDITISENCWELGAEPNNNLPKAMDFDLEEGLCYEDYYKSLKDVFPNIKLFPFQFGNSSGDNGDEQLTEQEKADYEASELWDEDEERAEKTHALIEKAARTNRWGSIKGDYLETIIAKRNISMPYKRILARFRTSMISSTRSLTRLRPNRRYGYEYMGRRYKDAVKLLIAVDSSGSISSEDLQNFFSVINRFFKFGVKEIKVIVFDTEIQQEMDFKKAQKSLQVKGRGGTDFQAAIDYYEKANDYDGLIVFTDGYASKPKITKKRKILWILNGKWSYSCNKDWIKKIPNSEVTWIDAPKKTWR